MTKRKAMEHKNFRINVSIKVSIRTASQTASGATLGQMDNITMESG